MQLFFWIASGLLGGWLTGRVMTSEGRDMVMDLMMGVAGAAAAGFVVSAMGLPVRGAMIFTDLAAIAGGVILTALARIVGGRREYASTD